MAYINFQPSDYFNTVTYTGNSSSQSVTGVGFQPDFLWIKRRSSTSTHALFNSTVGRDKSLGSESTDAEYTSPSDKDLISFDSNGFTVAQPNQRNVNGSGQTFVGWSWKANGGTTSSNTDGSITSTVQANTTAGFSVVTYTGTGSNATVGHGLGKALKFLIVKDRDASEAWIIHSQILTGTTNGTLHFNSDTEYSGASTQFQGTNPTSSVFYIGTAGNVNTNTQKYVAYCFAEIEGYSKFGNYTGNGNADGTFVYTGFKPAWILWKRTNSTTSWRIMDTARDTFNVAKTRLFASNTDADNTGQDTLDFLSNGFKHRATNSGGNASGGTYIYMAFAEHPLVASNGLPATAR